MGKNRGFRKSTRKAREGAVAATRAGTATAASTAAAAINGTTLRPDISTMSIPDMKSELLSLGGNISAIIEKADLEAALRSARIKAAASDDAQHCCSHPSPPPSPSTVNVANVEVPVSNEQKGKEKTQPANEHVPVEAAQAAEGDEVSPEPNSRMQVNVVDALIEDWICPISLELPFDPVTAEDGFVYNKADIQKYIANFKTDKGDGSDNYVCKGLLSPMTKESMGPRLFPATQVRNTIRKLVRLVPADDSTEQWKEVDEMRTKAENCDPRAMCIISNWYGHGEKGLAHDEQLAFNWACKAADLGFAPAIGIKGKMLLEGIGVKKSVREGDALIGVAAAKNDSLSQFYLGRRYFKGEDGFNEDFVQAKYWLERAIEPRGGLDELGDNIIHEALEMVKKTKFALKDYSYIPE